MIMLIFALYLLLFLYKKNIKNQNSHFPLYVEDEKVIKSDFVAQQTEQISDSVVEKTTG